MREFHYYLRLMNAFFCKICRKSGIESEMSVLKPKVITTLKGYSREQLINDVTAGIIVAIIALPLSIALAIASGVSPERGLYTAIVAGFITSLLGGSRVLIGGPTGAFMVIVYGIVDKYGVDGLIMATFMAGIILVLMGFFKLGKVVKYIPSPITLGFTSGIAVVIFSSQIKDFFGMSIDNLPSAFIPKWQAYFMNLNAINYQALIIGIIALVIIVIWPSINKKIPGALIALIVTSVLAFGLNMDVATIGSKYGSISSSIPKPHIPNFDISKIPLLIGPAFTIALLGAIESLLAAVVSDGMIGGKHRSNMELIAQGCANMGSALFGGIPATGAIARTVANIKNGGRTPIAGMVHSMVLLLIMLIFMPFAKMIPLASLSAILIIVAYNMSEWREFKEFLKSPKYDVLVLMVTFIITVLIDLVKAIEIGMVLSSFLFMKRMIDVSEIIDLDAAEELNSDEGNIIDDRFICNNRVKVYEINGPLFFGAADMFLNVQNKLGEHIQFLVLRMRSVPTIDATALNALKRIIYTCEKKGIKLIITEANTGLIDSIQKTGILKAVECYKDFEDAIEAIPPERKGT